MWNRATKESLERDLRGGGRTSDIFCVVGPSGSGKTTLVTSVVKHIRHIIIDEFADFVVGEESKRENRGYLSTLMEDARPCIVVLDSLDTVANISGTLRNIKVEYEEYKRYARPNKAIILTLTSTNDFAIRTWLRETRAIQYRMRDRMNWSDQSLLAQHIQTVVALRNEDPIRSFHGDFRRMGIDLTTCAQETTEFGRNTNRSEATRSANIFQMTEHLLGWPQLPLVQSLISAETKSLWNMCAGNHTRRVSQPDSQHANVFDELARTTMDLSDCLMVREHDDEQGLLVQPRDKQLPRIDTNQSDVFLLVQSFYLSNRRLGRHLQRPGRLEFVRAIPRVCHRADLDNPMAKNFDNEKRNNNNNR